MNTTHTPTNISQVDPKTLSITWSDDTQCEYNVRDLRLACRCALCVDEITGTPKINEANVLPTVVPKSIKPIGHYAFHIDWNDGHSTGFYRYDTLYALGKAPKEEKKNFLSVKR